MNIRSLYGRVAVKRIDLNESTRHRVIPGSAQENPPKNIPDPIKQVRMQIQETTSRYDRAKLQERLAKMTHGVAISKVGGVDPAKIVRAALQNAAPIASITLTAEAAAAGSSGQFFTRILRLRRPVKLVEGS